MKYNIFVLSLILLLIILAQSCKQVEKAVSDENTDEIVESVISDLNLGSTLNSPNDEDISLATNQPSGKRYLSIQKEGHQYKESAPFVEYSDDGKTERLWFTTSRLDDKYYAAESTNYYYQLYFSERQIEEGKTMYEGWSEPQLFFISTDNPSFINYYRAFNNAKKGAVSIANNMMVVSCERFLNIMKPSDKALNNLWSLIKYEDEYINPTPLEVLSSPYTWESQPSLSSDGNHIFYISNRKVNDDLTYNEHSVGVNTYLYYSFRNEGDWQPPVLVKELYGDFNVATPFIKHDNSMLYFSSDKNGNSDIYEVEIKLLDDGGYLIDEATISLFSRELIHIENGLGEVVEINDDYNQKYPFWYSNPENKKMPQALIWSSDNPYTGFGGFDLYGCNMPYKAEMNVVMEDVSKVGNRSIESPVIELEGFQNSMVEDEKAEFTLFSGLNYKLKGGSNANLYVCNIDSGYIFKGYSVVNDDADPSDRDIHSNVMNGTESLSLLTKEFQFLPVHNLSADTTISDTIHITKAWERKERCPEILDIPPKHSSIAYFQTGYWEVNTSENLERDLQKLHEGFEFSESNDFRRPRGNVIRKRSDYKAFDWEVPTFPIIKNDGYSYSIANARWIELHPNNLYWGDRPGFGSRQSERMFGREYRITQYEDYARKVDENLELLTDTIKEQYFDFLHMHSDEKPKLLIEIFAVSDQREVTRGWYIGDTIEYRASGFLKNEEFETEKVKIVPPKVDEKNKVITQLKACSIDLNEDGDNGSKLGIAAQTTEMNTNLSRLRAWFGYKEIYNRLTDSESFNSFLNSDRVALPDNDVSYDDADIIIVTQGRRHAAIANPKNPYPQANNPGNKGYYDYDDIRRVEVRIRLLYPDDRQIVKTFCCDPDA